MKTIRFLIPVLLFAGIVMSCKKDTPVASEVIEKKEFKVDFEKFTLDNGLQVVFHIDRSDPVVAVALTAHVGSAREKEGRTGFAHLFEHLLFLESENLGKGGLDKMSARIGGSGANGSTSRDRTNYYQTVPKDALEKMIWAEADKLGFFINTVTDPVLAKEKQVVKNEKRQSVDNRPYGHVNYVIGKNLYPADHPYNWQVIGSLEDLQNATLQDVKDFYNRWYVPNNVTLTIAGDFDQNQAKAWVHKYFDEIKRGEDISPLEKRPVALSETKKLYYEDNFARLPQLTITWPTVPVYHPDSYPLEVLSSYLSEGKKAPFNKVLVEEKQLTPDVTMFNFGSELAGEYRLIIRGFEKTNLNDIDTAITEAFAKFEAEGISQKDLDRIKAGQETDFYNGLSSVLGKGFQLAQYEIFAGDPGFINQDVKNILAVTAEDVKRVYNKYIKGKHVIATSFVPIGQTDLVLKDSKLAEVAEEKIVEGAEESFDASIAAEYTKTPSSFDRAIEPSYGESPAVNVPEVWEDKLSSGIEVYGIQNDEVPLVQFRINIRAGLLLEKTDKVGVSNILGQLMTKGTKNKTTEELENAIESLGASVNIFAGDENIVITGSTLSKNYDKTLALVQEIILEPRWDAKEFDLIKQSTISRIQQQKASPRSIAANQYAKLIYGENHILSHNNLGTEASVNSITLDDLKQYYEANIAPNITKVHIVGDISKESVTASLSNLNNNWTSKEVKFPSLPVLKKPEQSKVYFYDVPDAKQSQLRFGYPAVAATDADYYPLQIMNYRLGGGGFASQFTQQLREGKGYTYGIGSRFSGSSIPGAFTISSGVRSNVTYESSDLVKEILQNYGKNYNEDDLKITKSALIKSNARAFETPNSKINMLMNISTFKYPKDYVTQRENIVNNMTIDNIKKLSDQYLDPNKMIYLVVGDAKTQLKKLEQLGFGTPVLLNEKNESIKD
ncbi:pitrilysin family protein [Aquimarina sp. 2201CG5-10]|uniref:M16 family metallopeptidase n=1 Tax=Aquimarina callyspongiae TaxID=3098150 RepID=UPI002AB46D36|nr:pitrilysin family protein [Aquimarina sp. 2201CG5-10]MDY8134057.1 pitrilysin family protein [Aquimarina sp. 2201CG5-10]